MSYIVANYVRHQFQYFLETLNNLSLIEDNENLICWCCGGPEKNSIICKDCDYILITGFYNTETINYHRRI